MAVRKLSSFLVLVLVSSVLVAVPAREAQANHSHFRYGSITWQNLGGNEVLFQFTAAWRRDAYSGTAPDGRPAVGDIILETVGGTTFNFGNGSTGTLRFLVTAIDPANNWLNSVALHPGTNNIGLRRTYASPGTYTAFSQTCCRFTHVNNSNGTYRLEVNVTVDGESESPVSTLPPIVSCARNAVCRFAVPAADADGGPLTWRLASGAEWSNARQPGPPNASNAATIDPQTGIFTWDTTGAAQSPFTSTPSGPKSYYSAQVMVTDAQGHKIPVDFLIDLVDEVGEPPVIDLPECGTTVAAFLGQPITWEVTATDADPDDEVLLNVLGLPSGATMTPRLPVSGNPAASTFAWTPQPGQQGVHVLQFTAIDSAGQTALCPVTIHVGEVPPMPAPLPVPGGPYTVPEGGAVVLTGSADPGEDHRPVEFAWDLDGNGEFETAGATPSFDASVLDGPGTVEVAMRVCNADSQCDTDTATIEVVNVPPEVDAGPDLIGRTGEPIVLDGWFADPAGDADAPYEAVWTVDGDAEVQSPDHGDPVLRSVTFEEAGVYPAELTVTDADGDGATSSAWLTVAAVDPDCSGAGPTIATLWSPNHSMAEIGIVGVTHPEGDEVTLTVTGIYQDEPVDHIGDGSFEPDGDGVGTPTAFVRRERQGGGNGRFYHIFFEATTASGGFCEGAVRVVVPHDRAPHEMPVDDGPLYDSTVASDPSAPAGVAFGSRHTVVAGATLVVDAPGVLGGAVHPEGSPLEAVLVDGPAEGELELRTDGSFTYVAPLHHGEYPFTFSASDGATASALATVVLTVVVPSFPLHLPDRVVWTGEDTPVELGLFARGEGAEDATFALLGVPSHGTAVVDGDIVTYTPGADFEGEDLFLYEASSSGQTSNAAVVRVVVTPSNDTPVASGVSAAVAEDASVLINVLAHATDADGDDLGIVHLTDPVSGIAVVDDGQVRYTPEPDFFGTDRFRYRVADPDGAIAAAWVNVTVTEVNDPPVTTPAEYTITWDDGFLQVPAGDLAANDVPGPPNEADQTLTVTRVEATEDTHGSVVLEAGVVTWTPAEEFFVGVAHFRYEVCDDGTTAGEPDPQCAPGDAFVTVEEVNRPPVADDQQVTTAEDTPVGITLTGSDVNGDPLTFAVLDPPQHGAVVGLPPLVTYTPDPDYFGPDAFTFVANDDEFDSAPATVSITVTEVNDPPVTSDVHYTIPWGETQLVVPAQGFAASDVPGPPNESDQTLTVVGVEATPDTHGTLVFADGTVTFTPEEGFEGEARFLYEVCDDGTTAGEPDPLCATGTVIVDVAGPPPPAANDVEVTLAEDTHVTVDVTANDTHPDGLSFAVAEVSDPAHGVAAVVTMGPDTGSVFYKPDADYFGPDQFIYTVEDTRGGRSTATVFVTVTEVNDAPVASDVHYTITWLEVLEVPAVELTDNDVAGPPNESDQTLTVVAVEATADTHGTVTFADGVVTYTPEPDFVGEARFLYEVCDDGTTAGEPDPLCATGTVVVTVEAVNRPPVAFDREVTTTEGVPVEITLGASDPDGDPLTYLLASLPEHGGLFGTPPALTYVPDDGFTGTDSFEFWVNDGQADSDLATVTITVQEAVVEALAVAPASITLEPGQDWQFTATATLDSGDTVDVTGQAAWSSSDEAVAVIDAAGLVTAAGDGAATITAAYDGFVATAGVNVESIDLDEIVLDPSTGTLLVGDSVELRAVGVRADGTSVPLTADAVWVSDDETVATLSGTDPVLVTVVGSGTATITATVGGVTGGATITGVAPVDDAVPPTALIASPAGGDELTERTTVTGTADDDNLLKWVLDYAPAGGSSFTAIVEGTEPVIDGALGAFDPTTLLNDLYTLRLRVYDRGGHVATDTVVVQVAGDQKAGMFSLAFDDLSVPLSGMPVRVTRHYDSRDKTRGDFGIGWQLDIKTNRVRVDGVHGRGWQMVSSGGFIPTYSIVPTREHKATITLPDGHVEEFDMVPVPSSQQLIPPQFLTATYQARPGTRGTLQPLGNNGLIVTGPTNNLELVGDTNLQPYDPTLFAYTSITGERFTIHVADGVRNIRDTNGNTITISASGITHSAGVGVQFTRDGQGRITAITDPAGNTQTYTYDINGDLSAHTDALGNATTFRYNRSHGLLEIRDPLGRQPLRVEYDEDGRIAATIDAEGNRVEIDRDIEGRQEIVRDRRGNVTVYVYDERGNVLAQIDPDGNTIARAYDDDGNELTTTDALGNTTSRTYDSRGLLLTQTDPEGNTTTWTYNNRGQVLTEADGDGNTVTYTYDANGNETSRSDPRGETTTSAFDSRGNRTTTTDASGNILQYTYDSAGNRVGAVALDGSESTYTFDANGNETSETVTRTTTGGTTVTETTTRAYDSLGRLVGEVDPQGGITTWQYDAVGQQIAVTDPLGRTTTNEFDTAGNIIRTLHPDGTEESWDFDAEGNRTRWVDRAGRETTYAYDRSNRLVATAHPDGSQEEVVRDAAGREVARVDENGNRTDFELDDAGQRVKTIDALGGETTYERDAVGRPRRIVDEGGNVFEHTYDEAGNVLRTDYPDGTFMTSTYDAVGRVVSETDPAGRVTTYAWDPAGRLVNVTDPLGGQTTFSYDELGNKLSHTDANGRTTTFAYDALGRQTARTLPLGMTETMAYDAAGNMVSHTDFNGATVTYAYDAADRLVTTTYPGGETVTRTHTATGLPATLVDGRGTTTHSYDDRDRLVLKQEPDGSTIGYAYDPAGNVTTITSSAGRTTYTYDALHRVTSVEDHAGGLTAYSYGPTGNRVAASHPDGASTTYTHDAMNRLTALDVTDFGGSTLLGQTYDLSPAGERLRVTEHDGREVAYSYDALSRLTSETVDDPVEGTFIRAFTYDAVGNRLTHVEDGDTVTYAYDANDRLLTQGSTSFTYDDNGNTVTVDGPDGPTSLTYDAEDRLVEFDVNGQTTEYGYDGDGNRVSVTAGGDTLHLLVDANRAYGNVLEERGGDGTLLASYSHAHGPISLHRDGQTSYYHRDALGSTRLLTDTGGAVTDRYRYAAFGALDDRSGATDNRYLFTGERFEEASGLYHLRARDYDPSTGRFRTIDPFAGVERDPVSLHRYLYANANPLTYTDPGGEMSMVMPMPPPITISLPTISMAAVLAKVQLAAVAVAKASVVACAAGALLAPLASFGRSNPCGVTNYNILYSGSEMEETTQHISEALALNPAWANLDRGTSSGSRGWYRRVPPCAGNVAATSGKWCDEYPFFSTKQGGGNAVPTPSLRLVPAYEQRIQGGKISAFYRACGVRANDPIKGAFGVVPIDSPSLWVCRTR